MPIWWKIKRAREFVTEIVLEEEHRRKCFTNEGNSV